MAWTEDIYPHIQLYDSYAFQAPQQPTTILQQLPVTTMPPSLRPGGHVKEDLVELMMIQTAQMHQVIMNNMTVSALRLFGYSSPAPGNEAPRDVVIIQENEADPEVYHHYYEPAPHLSYPPWVLPQATLHQEDPNKPSFALPHRDSTSGTLGADSSPAAGKSNYTATPGQHPVNTQSAPVMSRGSSKQRDERGYNSKHHSDCDDKDTD